MAEHLEMLTDALKWLAVVITMKDEVRPAELTKFI